MDNLLKCGISCYSNYLKIYLEYGYKFTSYSEKLLNFDDIMVEKIDELAIKIGKSFKDINILCVVKGPGRFSAIRSAFTFASIYKIISGCEVYSVDIFGCLAYNIFENDRSDKDIAVISHAFRDEYYLSFYRINKNKLFELEKPKWIFLDELIRRLERFDGFIIYDKDEFDFDLSQLNNKNLKLPSSKIMRVIPKNIVNSSLYFKDRNYKPIYLKPAKFEVK